MFGLVRAPERFARRRLDGLRRRTYSIARAAVVSAAVDSTSWLCIAESETNFEIKIKTLVRPWVKYSEIYH